MSNQLPAIVFCGARIANGCTLYGEPEWMSVITAIKDDDGYLSDALHHTACKTCARYAKTRGATTVPFIGYSGTFVEFVDQELLQDEPNAVVVITRPSPLMLSVTEAQAREVLLSGRGQVRGWLMKAGLKDHALEAKVAEILLSVGVAEERGEWGKVAELAKTAIGKAKAYYLDRKPWTSKRSS